MTEFKLVISDPQAKKAFQIESKSPDADRLIGKRIGETIRGETINLPGFEFQITGGSDKQGFPMRKDVHGTKRVRILIHDGPGIRKPKKGLKLKKSVRGNQISDEIAQVNMKVVKTEGKSLAAALGKEENPTAEKKEGEA